MFRGKSIIITFINHIRGRNTMESFNIDKFFNELDSSFKEMDAITSEIEDMIEG